jgi:hypothetical protein
MERSHPGWVHARVRSGAPQVKHLWPPRGRGRAHGVGSGRLTRHLVDAGHRVVATDAFPAMLDLAEAEVADAAGFRRLVPPDDPLPDADAIVSVGHAPRPPEGLVAVIGQRPRPSAQRARSGNNDARQAVDGMPGSHRGCDAQRP